MGSYQARSIIAEAQSCINLFPESNPPDSPFPMTHYPTPGLVTMVQKSGMVRGMWVAQNGAQFVVIANTLYYVDNAWALHSVGTLASNSGIISLCDNGLVLIVVDGTASGYVVDLTDNQFGKI